MKTLTLRTTCLSAALLTGCTLSNSSSGGAEGLNLETRSDRPSDRSVELYLNPGENPLAALNEVETEDGYVLANNNVVVGSMMNELGSYFSAATLYQPNNAPYETETEQCEGSTLPDAVEVICGNIAAPEDDPETEENEAEGGVQLLFIDETPTFAQHRVTGRRLLECARAAGFEYFVIEALAEPASDLVARGYVSKTASGTILREPQFAGLVEDAMALGYTPISLPPDSFCAECTPAEAFSRSAEPKADSLIQQTLDVNPKAKVLVWTAPGQAFEQKWGARPFIDSLASFVFTKTSIDPYTFIQLTIEPRASFGPATASGIFVATGPNNGSCSGSYSPGSATGLSTHDGVIIHVAPPVGSRGSDAERWAWLHTPAANQMSVTPECATCMAGQRLLVQAFPPAVDTADRVPADQVLCAAGDTCQLALPPGDYQLVVWSEAEQLGTTQVTLAAGTPTTVTMN
ncbi:MAG TPA: hypothetical protein VMG12_26460 [Polyangiaceae bacterium]|nr:hypothetical protein [Polyangiaceae bacterium]